MAAYIFYMITLIQMRRPKMRVFKMQPRHQHIAAMWQIQQSWSLLILICALWVPLPSQPERFPRLKTISIYCSGSTHGKAIYTICIDQSHKIQTGLPLYAGHANRVIGDILTPLQYTTLCNIQIDSLLKSQCSCSISASWNYKNTTTVLRCSMNKLLNLFCIQLSIITDPIICQNILCSKLCQFRDTSIIKPTVNLCSIGKIFHLTIHSYPHFRALYRTIYLSHFVPIETLFLSLQIIARDSLAHNTNRKN